MKTAFVHDWLTVYAGAERVLEQMLQCYPDSDVFSIIDFVSKDEREFLRGKDVKTSFVQRLPGSKKHYRSYLPIMTFAVEQIDLSEYDIIISSSHAVSKGVITGPDQLHICMCYSPMRYAWDLQNEYLKSFKFLKSVKVNVARMILHWMRIWDFRSAQGVDAFIAISEFVSRRIRKVYRRESAVIHPPVNVDFFSLQKTKDDFYVTASRLVPYKRVDLIVKTFSQMPQHKLVVIGDGPEFSRIKALAGSNIQLLGQQPAEVLRDYLQRAKAFVFAAEEDFGIAPLEAQSCGTPVIAYGKGGALETLRGLDSASPTGLFFQSQDIESLKAAVVHFEEESKLFSAEKCRENALRFSTDQFRTKFMDFVEREWVQFR